MLGQRGRDDKSDFDMAEPQLHCLDIGQTGHDESGFGIVEPRKAPPSRNGAGSKVRRLPSLPVFDQQRIEEGEYYRFETNS